MKQLEPRRRLSKALAVLLAFALLAGTSGQAFAADGSSREQKTVRIGYYEDNNGFQQGFSDGERKSGYAYEYYQEISKYTGWKYTYVYGNWSTLYDQLLSGEIDIMAGVSKTEARMGQMLFPANEMGTESYYVFTPINSYEITSDNPTSLNGKRIGVNDKSLMLTLFRQYVEDIGLDCEIVTYEGSLDCSEALQRGEIDGYVITDNYVVEGVKPVIKIGSSDIYFALSQNRTDLLSDINRAQEQILAASPYYATYLQSKYFNRSVLRQALNDEELSWLEGRQSIDIGFLDELMPYSGTDPSTGNGAGLIETLQKSIAGFLQSPVNLKAYQSTDDMLSALKSGEIDAAFPLYGDTWTAEQQGIFLTDEIATGKMVAVYEGNYDVSLLEKAAEVKDGFGQAPYLAQFFPQTEITLYDDVESCIAAIKSGKATCMITDNNTIQRYFSENPADADLHYASMDDPISLCMAVSDGGTILQSILNKAIAHMDSSELTDAIARNTYAPTSYTFQDFIARNTFFVVSCLSGLILLLALTFLLYRKNSLRQRRQLREANLAKSEFLSRMSHDIRTPMNAIVNLTTLAKAELHQQDKLERDLERISVSSEFLLGLINDILDMSRIENGKLSLSPSVYHYSEFLNYVDGIIKPLCAQKDIFFVCDLGSPDSFQDIWIDRTRFNQIFFNILSNAVKYTDAGGTVSFSMKDYRRDETYAFCDFVIEDTGCGMSEEFLEKVFLPFERANSTDAYTGTGLGLAIAKSIIDAMDGSIAIDSQPGIGSTVTVRLRMPFATPAQIAGHDETARDLPCNDQQIALQQDFHGKRILIAEDHPLNQEIVTRLLEKVGLEPECTTNGQECVERFRDSEIGTYGAILMDIRMPVMDGLTATREIRSMDRRDAQTIPIIAMTANAFADDVAASKEAGMDAHLSKPVVPEKLYQFLATYLRG